MEQIMLFNWENMHYLNFHRDIVQICTMMSFHESRDWLAEYILTIEIHHHLKSILQIQKNYSKQYK